MVGGVHAGWDTIDAVDVELLDLSEPNPCWKEGEHFKLGSVLKIVAFFM